MLPAIVNPGKCCIKVLVFFVGTTAKWVGNMVIPVGLVDWHVDQWVGVVIAYLK